MYFTLCAASTWGFWSWGRGVRSFGRKGSIPYTTLNGERPVALLGALLYANSACGKSKSQALACGLIKALRRVPRVRLVTSVWPSV